MALLRCVALCTTALWIAGCAIDAEDIESWRDVAGGEQRLGGYLVDAERPLELRLIAADELLKLGALDQVVGAVADTAPEERKPLLTGLATMAARYMERSDAPEMQARAAALAFHLLRFLDELPDRSGERLVAAATDWALNWLSKEDPPSAGVTAEDVLLATVLVRPAQVRPVVVEHLRAIPEARQLLRLHTLLSRARDEALQRQLSQVLLDFARRRYPDIEVALAEAMAATRDETLLRFLLDAVRDPRVPRSTRDVGIIAARDQLGGRALDGYFRLLRSDDPANRNDQRFNALDLVWDFGGVERLAEALRALPARGTWPAKGEEFRAEVDRFCDNRVARQKAAARSVLLDLLADPSWVARAYAMQCIIRLYPDDAPVLLEPLARDETPLPGWSIEGDATIADVVKALQAR